MMKPKIFFILFPVILFFSSCKTPVKKSIPGLNPRKGLPSFFEKIHNHDSITIVYFGGSITEAAGWRTYSSNWMREYFQLPYINQVNAAIGGTSSEFGAYRLERDVLSHEPDLVLVEFAVNDRKNDSLQVIKSMEGITRGIKKSCPGADICFIYTLTENYVDSINMGHMFLSLRCMERVADHYGIPSMNLGMDVAKRVKEGSLIFSGDTTFINNTAVFSRDGVHPYKETGHHVYNEVFKKCMIKLKNLKNTNIENTLPSPLEKNNLEKTKFLHLPPSSFIGNWKKINETNSTLPSDLLNKIPFAMSTSVPGDCLSFKFKGTTFGIHDIIGPKTNKIKIEVDNLPPDTISRFDAWCSFYRKHFFIYPDLENQEHFVKITVLNEPIDKDSILQDNNDYINNPAEYKDLEWHVIALLINGDLIP